MKYPISRRSFLGTASAASVAAMCHGLRPARTAADEARSPLERPRAVFIGLGLRSKSLSNEVRPIADLVGVCDVDLPRTEQFNAEKPGGKANVYADYRKAIETEKPDVVVIATPDH